MSGIKLFGFPETPRIIAPRIVAELSGVDIEFVDTPIFDHAKLSDDFKAKFPKLKVPALEHGDVRITETLAVSYYIASQSTGEHNLFDLFGSTNIEKTQVLEWASFANSHFFPTLASWYIPIVRGPYNKKASDDGKVATQSLFAYLNTYLETRTFLVSERITFADIFLGCAIQRGGDHVVDEAFISQYPNVKRFYKTVVNQPAALKVYGTSPTLIAKPKEYTAPAKEPKAAKAPAAAPAAAAPKAEKPKKAAKAADDDEEEDDSAAANEPKAKHPCEALGKPVLNLEDWKRKYSNEDTPKAMEWFAENYKPDEYSLWRVTYKYPEELSKKVFMNSNLIGGFHTRLEGSRKYLFGNACVYGEDNADKHAIQGAYLCRGAEWKPVFEVGPDYESYEFTPLDFSKPEDKEFVSKNWAWEDEVDGMKAVDGKVFK